MNTIFQKNVQALKTTNPDLFKIVNSLKSVILPEGAPFNCKTTFLQPSLVDSSEVSSAEIVVFFGFNTPRHISYVVNKTTEKTLVLVVEASVELFVKTLAGYPAQDILENPRVRFAVHEQDFFTIRQHLESFFGYLSFSNIVILKEPHSIQLDREYYRKFEKELLTLKSVAALNRRTIQFFSAEWNRHILLNLSHILSSHGVERLFGKFRGVPAVVVSAGPSLDKNLKWLKHLSGRAVIISVDSAFNTLRSNDVDVHFVLCVDSQEKNFSHMEEAAKTPEETILVMSPVTYPALPQIFQGTLLLMGYNIPLMNWIERLTGPFGEMLVGGSVSTSAYDFARKLGCNPVVLCGQDLSYEFSRGYVSGSLYSSIFEKDLKHNNNMESLQGDHVALFGTLTGKNIFGGPVLSNEEMLSWKNWYEAVSASGSTINSTEGGLDIGGFTIQPLKKTVALSFSQEFPIKKIISDSLAKKREFDISKLLSNLGEYGNSLGTVIDLARQGLKCCSELSRSSLKKLSEEGTGNRFGHLHILSSSIMAETTFLETNQWEIDILLDKLSKTEGNGEGSIKTKLAGYKELFKGVLEISQKRNNDLQEGINKFSSCTSKSG